MATVLDLYMRKYTPLTPNPESRKEVHGPCPFCGGTDRFVIWMDADRYWCRQCGRSGNAIQFARDVVGLDFREAQELVGGDTAPTRSARTKRKRTLSNNGMPPTSRPWGERAAALAFVCQNALWATDRPLTWLRDVRGLADETLGHFGIGYNATERHERGSEWGLDKDVWIPRGITIPWYLDVPVENTLWNVRIRRPEGKPKYVGLPAAGNGLFNYADQVLPALICEGEIDAMTVWQEASDLVLPLATGGTQNAHLSRWVARLARLPLVLIAFDTDAAGEATVQWWLECLKNAVVWPPTCHDINDMLTRGEDVRRWIQEGLMNGRK